MSRWIRWQLLMLPVAPCVALEYAQMLIATDAAVRVGDGTRPTAALVSCAIIVPLGPFAGEPDAVTVAATVDAASPASTQSAAHMRLPSFKL